MNQNILYDTFVRNIYKKIYVTIKNKIIDSSSARKHLSCLLKDISILIKNIKQYERLTGLDDFNYLIYDHLNMNNYKETRNFYCSIDNLLMTEKEKINFDGIMKSVEGGDVLIKQYKLFHIRLKLYKNEYTYDEISILNQNILKKNIKYIFKRPSRDEKLDLLLNRYISHKWNLLSISHLHIKLLLSLIAIKTPYCNNSVNTDCISCYYNINIPSNRFISTVVVCQLSGDILDENNSAVVTKDNRVVSRKYMEDNMNEGDIYSNIFFI